MPSLQNAYRLLIEIRDLLVALNEQVAELKRGKNGE